MSYRETVNEYISQFAQIIEVDIDPLDGSGYTSVCRGSAAVGINVVEESGVVVFISPIMRVPKQRSLELYERLLDLNYLATSDAAFAIDRERELVCLRALRAVDGMTFEGFVDLLDTVATTADEWDGKLKAEFGDTT